MQLRRQKFSEMLGYEFPRKLSGTGSSREYSLLGIVLCLAGKSSGVTSIGISWIDGLQKRRRLSHDTGRTKTPARGKAAFLDHAGGLIVTVAAASTMVQAAAESSQPTAEEYLQEIGAENAQRAALADLYKEWEDGNN